MGGYGSGRVANKVVMKVDMEELEGVVLPRAAGMNREGGGVLDDFFCSGIRIWLEFRSHFHWSDSKLGSWGMSICLLVGV